MMLCYLSKPNIVTRILRRPKMKGSSQKRHDDGSRKDREREGERERGRG